MVVSGTTTKKSALQVWRLAVNINSGVIQDFFFKRGWRDYYLTGDTSLLTDREGINFLDRFVRPLIEDSNPAFPTTDVARWILWAAKYGFLHVAYIPVYMTTPQGANWDPNSGSTEIYPCLPAVSFTSYEDIRWSGDWTLSMIWAQQAVWNSASASRSISLHSYPFRWSFSLWASTINAAGDQSSLSAVTLYTFDPTAQGPPVTGGYLDPTYLS